MAEPAEAATRTSSGASPSSTPPLEWLSAGLGLATVIGLFGVIGWQALDRGNAAPAIVVETGETSPVLGGYRVEIRARNKAIAAAAQVEVEATLAMGDRIETGRVTFDYVAGRSTRTGWMTFGADPRSGRLSLRAVGYAQP